MTGVVALPVPGTSFLGRESELDECDTMLSSSRLLTVTGPGGVGKTRFALELGRRVTRNGHAYEGVFASFLAPLRNPSLVLPTIAQTLSVVERPGQNAQEAIAQRLAGERTLLVLDNLEHLTACAGELATLVSECPGLTLLVTSRARLRMPSELEYQLPPLRREEGVALFCERARTEPTPTIGDLCARLEGLPLAIELAAARMDVLSPEQLLERLSRRLDVLKGAPDRDPRQQTLRATIAWSFELLSPQEQELFARLAAFEDGCAPEAAAEVAGADVDGLESLVDKSLLRRTAADAEPRYWMLETIREFALEQLRATGDMDDVLARHTASFLGLAERLAPRRYGSNTAEERVRLAAERANFRSALGRAIDAEDAEVALRFVRLLGDHWHEASGLSESYELARVALALPGGDRSDRAHALLRAGRLAFEVGDEAGYRALYAESEAALVELRDRRGLWQLLEERSFYESVGGNHDVAIRTGERAVELARELGLRDLEMISTAVLAEALLNSALAEPVPDQGALRRSREMYQPVLEWARTEATGTEEFVFALNYAWLLLGLGDVADALEWTQRGVRIALRERTAWRLLSDAIMTAACAATGLGLHHAGAVLLAASQHDFDRDGQVVHPNVQRRLAETTAALRAALGAEAYEQAVREGEELGAEATLELALGLGTGPA